MPTLATDIVKGPAIVKYKSAVLFSAGDIKLEDKISTFTIPNPLYGERDIRYDQKVTEITFKPIGHWNLAMQAALWPYLDAPVMTNMFANASDVVIHSIDGNTVTVSTCAVTSMPGIKLSAKNTMIGDCTIRSYQPDATTWSTHTLAASAFSETSFLDSGIPTIPYRLQWGAVAPWDDCDAKDGGFDLAFSMETTPEGNDRMGTLTEFVKSVRLEVKFTPAAATTAQMQALLKPGGTGIRRGARMQAINGNDLFITGDEVGDPTFSIDHAVPTSAPIIFGTDSLRGGEVVFAAERGISAGVLGPIMTIGEIVG